MSVNLLRENADFDETKHLRLNSRDEFYPQRAPAGFSSGMRAARATVGAPAIMVPAYPVAAWVANVLGADSIYRYEFGKIPPGYGVTLVPATALADSPGLPANIADSMGRFLDLSGAAGIPKEEHLDYVNDHLNRQGASPIYGPVSLYAIYRDTPLGENEFDSDILRVRVYGSHEGAESLLGVMPLNLRMRAFSPPEAINVEPVTLSRVDARMVSTVTVTVYQSKRVTRANSAQ